MPDDQPAEVDAWPDGKYPERKRDMPREDYPSVFDSVPRAK